MVELAVVEQHVRVGVGGHGERALTDARADQGPGLALPVPQADPAVAEVVRRPGRRARRLAARAIAVRSAPASAREDRTIRARSSRGGSVATTAAKRSGGSDTQRPRRPFSTARRTRQRVFGSSRSPQAAPSPRAPRRASRSRRGRAARARIAAASGRGRPRSARPSAESAPRSARAAAARGSVARRVVLDAGEVEHLRKRGERLADRLAFAPGGVERGDESATSVGVISSTRREPSSGSTRASWTRWPTAVPSVTSTREARQRSAASLSVGAVGEAASSALTPRDAHRRELARRPSCGARERRAAW